MENSEGVMGRIGEDASDPRLIGALVYAYRGWAVLPLHAAHDGACSCGSTSCGNRGKHPVGKLAPCGFKDAATDEAVLRSWWSSGGWNVGVATGAVSGIVVLDVDPRNGGLDSLRVIEQEHGKLPQSPCVVTGGGGLHFYFRYPGYLVGSRIGLRPGLDVRADGGYVVAPPSRHGSGRDYVWKVTQRFDEIDLPEVPPWLLDLIGSSSTRSAALEIEVGKPIPEGARNAKLMSLAGTMRRRGMTESEIVAALMVANADRCTPPLDEDEVRGIAASVSRYEPAEPEVGTVDSAAGPKERAAAAKTLFRTAEEIARTTTARIPWIAKPWVARGAITEVGGKIKTAGKTTWVSHLCRAVLDGSLFIDEPTLQSPVVWLTEQSDVSFREVLRRSDLLGRNDLHVLSSHKVAGRPWRDVANLAITHAERVGAHLVIVDTLSRFAGMTGDGENRAGEAEAAVTAISEPAAARNVGVIFVRHERKSGGDVGDAARGSSAIGGAVDVILSLRRLDNAPRDSMRVIKGIGRFDETPGELVIELVAGRYVRHGTAEDIRATVVDDAVLRALPEDEANAVTVEDIVDGSGMKRTTVQQVLKRLEDAKLSGHVGTGKRGNAFRYHRVKDSLTSDAVDVAAGAGALGAAATTPAILSSPCTSLASTPVTLSTATTNSSYEEEENLILRNVIKLLNERHAAKRRLSVEEAIDVFCQHSSRSREDGRRFVKSCLEFWAVEKTTSEGGPIDVLKPRPERM